MMFDVMIIRVEAATKTENGYTYSTDGLVTSNTLIYEERINNYKVIERNIETGKTKELKMSNYLIDYNT